ncbi:MAG: ribosome biogenesis GTPase YlqF [Oscillospiraceae bacterium]|jgi:ribosome biogenesis GTPase A|nr:ribosome biogenesis GTPase YlqF [Oscillospiraceae bacterium]
MSENNSEPTRVQWFPGHMAKARRKIAEDLKLVDAVVEIRDARCPDASENADVAAIVERRPRLIVLNRADQADEAATKRWAKHLQSLGFNVLIADSKSGRGVDRFEAAAKITLAEKLERQRARGLTPTARYMVIGIPNVGKSSFINRVAGRRAAVAHDKPGVTRGRQWISAGVGVELLDTPGVLPPKIKTPEAGEFLAFTGAVRDEILDTEALASRLTQLLWARYPERLRERYKFRDGEVPDTDAPLELIARRRGLLISGGELDTERAASVILDEFRAGLLGRVTLEQPPEDDINVE